LGGRVSVRSSATLEDARTHSFAGQFLTVLDVGPDGVEDAVRRVWASAFADNVVHYLERGGLAAEALKMAVVIQRQLASRASGVAMGDRRRVIVEAVLGQGEALVSGEALADRWEVAGGRIDSTAIAAKATRRVLGSVPGGALVHENVPAAEHTQPALGHAHVLEIAGICARIAEACGGRAQDCEFSVDGDTLYLLQTRDVTASLPVTAPPLPAFAPPGKGAWELDTAHFQRPVTRLFQEVFPAAMAAGFKAGTARYGALVSHLDYVFVNGFPYQRLRLVAAPEDATAKAPPPPAVFKLMLKLVPPLRRRVKTAERIWQTREWRAQLEEWQAAKARSIETHTRLQAIDPDALDDAALATHFAAALDNVRAMITQHHSYNLAGMVPTGDLIAHVRRWSGGKVSDGEVCALLAGASPVSADLRSPEARALGDAVAADPAARRLLRLDEKHAGLDDEAAVAALAELRALPGAAGERARAFLAHRELRLVDGLDLAAPCLRECPSLLWDALRSAALAREAAGDEAIDAAALAQVRAAVPAAQHAELDSMITEARAVVGLRDERALYSDVWAWGIARTIVLAIGRRLIARDPSLLVHPEDLIHADRAEIEALLAGRPGPSATELERRAAYVRAYTSRDAPPTLGAPAGPPPDPALLPPGLRRLMAGTLAVIELLFKTRVAVASADELHGFPASSGKWEGPVHLVNSHDDARDIAPGSVLVVGAGSSAFNMVAPFAAAVVAEGGGLLSHVAIVCREYRIPCVCGVPGALSALAPGQRVRVDGTRGVVELLAAA
ncbi:MAG: PEP/pyruvate-binding domain-containing protein, partial [Sphingomonadaceae bacterium]